MSDLLPQPIVLVLGGAIAPPLILLNSLFWGSQRPLPNTTALGLGTSLFCAAMGISGLTLSAEEAAGLRTPEDERR
jgi:hypothetical protein